MSRLIGRITTILLTRAAPIRLTGYATERDLVGDVALYNEERLSVETSLSRARVAELSRGVLNELRRISARRGP